MAEILILFVFRQNQNKQCKWQVREMKMSFWHIELVRRLPLAMESVI